MYVLLSQFPVVWFPCCIGSLSVGHWTTQELVQSALIWLNVPGGQPLLRTNRGPNSPCDNDTTERVNNTVYTNKEVITIQQSSLVRYRREITVLGTCTISAFLRTWFAEGGLCMFTMISNIMYAFLADTPVVLLKDPTQLFARQPRDSQGSCTRL